MPVEQYLDTLSNKHAAKVLRAIQLLEEFGPAIGAPHVETIVDDIQCLRVKHGSNIFRIFFFVWVGRTFVLLHGFTKKSQKTPRREIARAIAYRDDFLKRKGREAT
ncbi:type II toxin-antitoxin system RelE/ParE family toxin [Alicyclobacillus kakegawensis]|uniref:type II toxin-antitoxin system RelE/ParE family toxin n=1 Tax=Alicyclobacillus kakegawensis TaxID=392012 RepID=UPI001C3F20A0|nr:type II toxin-antitoxin system RelE/ParE family toxin [Alicyclobacillus kakegawensis]